MFKFPNAEGGEKKRLGAGKRSGGGHGVFAVLVTVGAVAWAAGFFARFRGFPEGSGSWAGDGMAIHGYNSNYY